MLQNLRCKTLTSFRFYKDVFLRRVMELTKCNSSHWKSKFIDGLPALFVERVRKTLGGDSHSINYDNYTYGKLICACAQEGLSLCNEIKLNQQVKRHHPNERQHLGEFCKQFSLDIPKASFEDRKLSSNNKSSKKDYKAWKKKRRFNKSRQKFGKSDTCHKCGRFDHYARDCKVKGKFRNLDIDENIKDSLCKILLNSESEETDAGYSSYEESSSNEDLRALDKEDCMTSDSECLPCQQGQSCDNKKEDDLYKIYSQFKELSINVIGNDKIIELLQIVKDPEIELRLLIEF
ncbi:hypothetical protein H5410_060475 [Solanum commersonii]|uniref:CCHC-type domain-containing protein n=1 Tax=Solanum commersonii TaxID=4109 RepID=A0A9J5W563_SOLCO|nr:hypothetical protein H5410_060475 [Solanum commersonii]